MSYIVISRHYRRYNGGGGSSSCFEQAVVLMVCLILAVFVIGWVIDEITAPVVTAEVVCVSEFWDRSHQIGVVLVTEDEKYVWVGLVYSDENRSIRVGDHMTIRLTSTVLARGPQAYETCRSQ